MRLVYGYLLLLTLLCFPLVAKSDDVIVPDVTSVSENENGHVISVEFNTYRYLEKYCKYEILLLIKNKGKNRDRILEQYIKKRDGFECGTSKEGYVGFFSPYGTIGNSYGEALNLLQLYSQECEKDNNGNITCIKLADFILLSVAGPEINPQTSYCYEFNFKNKVLYKHSDLTICANTEKVVSSKYTEIMEIR